MRTKLWVAILAVGLLAPACGANQPSVAPTPPPTSGPTTSQPTSGQPPNTPPGSTQAPATPPITGATPEPTSEPPVELPPEPLPEPELESPEEIVEAMFQPELAEQVVVSMLYELGIGLYQTDGTAIRAGTETSDSDFYLFEPEARGLVELFEETDDPDAWITFRE